MRTTIRLDDELLKEVKQLAAKSERSVSAVIEDALREMLYRRRRMANREPVRLPTDSGKGLQRGVDLDNSASLLDLMENTDASG